MKKIILITSSSSGIGKEFVKALPLNGHIVYGAARKLEKIPIIEMAVLTRIDYV